MERKIDPFVKSLAIVGAREKIRAARLDIAVWEKFIKDNEPIGEAKPPATTKPISAKKGRKKMNAQKRKEASERMKKYWAGKRAEKLDKAADITQRRKRK